MDSEIAIRGKKQQRQQQRQQKVAQLLAASNFWLESLQCVFSCCCMFVVVD